MYRVSIWQSPLFSRPALHGEDGDCQDSDPVGWEKGQGVHRTFEICLFPCPCLTVPGPVLIPSHSPESGEQPYSCFLAVVAPPFPRFSVGTAAETTWESVQKISMDCLEGIRGKSRIFCDIFLWTSLEFRVLLFRFLSISMTSLTEVAPEATHFFIQYTHIALINARNLTQPGEGQGF